METSLKGLLLSLAVVLAIRVPFLNQPIQGDDHIYLTEAAHAQIDPLHPKHTPYVFRGEVVDLRGQPHPPLNGWILGALLAVFGEVREVPFHAAYLLFSLIAVAAMWSLSARFYVGQAGSLRPSGTRPFAIQTTSPTWATLLFIAVPTFVVNGNSLEADLPFLAFWMLAIALFVADRLFLATLAMALAALAAYQAVFLTPILAAYLLLHRPKSGAGAVACQPTPSLTVAPWLVILTPPLTLAAWQIFERATTGAFPAAVLAGYLTVLETAHAKLANAIALTVHSWFIVCPALVPAIAVVAWRTRRDRDTRFLLAWIAIFFSCAVVVFFAGAARYLLPMAAPVTLLASRLRPRWLALGFAAQLALGLGLAVANYQHWDAYRQFARQLAPQTEGHRVWVDGEWGLRYYMESQGAPALLHTQKLRSGDIVVSSELGHSVEVTAPLTPIATMEIRPSVPLRIIGLETDSAYSTVSRGYWPFGVSRGVVDRVRASVVGERHPTLEYLPMNAPEADGHIVSGIYALEDNRYRWMSGRAVVALKSPGDPLPLRVVFTIPESAAARHVSLLLDGREVASASYAGPGSYTLASAPVRGTVVEVVVDRTFRAPPDARDLGIVLDAVGFVR
jgi:hypothetical protein